MNCRFCGAGSEYQEIKGNFVYGGTPNHKFWECSKCKIVYLYPPLSEDNEKEFYRREFEKYMEKRSGEDTKKGWLSPEEHIKTNQPELKRRKKFLEPFLSRSHRMKILEIGCSSGFMLLALRDMSHKVFGVEISGNFINFLKSKNIEIFTSIEEIEKYNIKFDLIIHYYVLEHVRNPSDFLQGYMKFLVNGGRMIFEVPNVNEPLISLYKVDAFDRFYWSIAHHWYFSPESMANLLNRLGYEYNLYFDQRYDLSNHIVWMLEGNPGGKGRYSDIFSSELDEIYKRDLRKSGVCDTLVVKMIK